MTNKYLLYIWILALIEFLEGMSGEGGYNSKYMLHIKQVVKKIPGIKELFSYFVNCYIRSNPMRGADYMYYHKFGRHINWENPRDINEKINWLKFHEDMEKWATYADKVKVREFVKEKGLEEILIPIFGVWNSVEELERDWENLPSSFVLKCNNGCGNLRIIENKAQLSDKELKKIRYEVKKWIATRDYGLYTAEPHYHLIKNQIYAEQLISNDFANVSKSEVDYKIWCFDGKAYGCFFVYDRDFTNGNHVFDYYDLDWNHHSEYMTDNTKKRYFEKPKNWEKMIEVAEMLSEGIPEVRIDLYNSQGRVYFGEMTMTSLGGYMDYFTQELLDDMGSRVTLDYAMPGNEFYDFKYVSKVKRT